MRRFAAVSLLGLMLLAACTPRVEPAGPEVGQPAIAADRLVMADGASLPLHAWLPEGPPRAVILALHGFNDAAGNFMGETAPLFTAQGIAVYAYDQRGFGAAPHRGVWAGAETLAADAATAARLIRARHPGLRLVMLGESMGAAVVIRAATRAGALPVDGYVLSAPALWGRASMNGLMRGALWLASHTIPLVAFPGSAGGIRASDNEEALRRWGRDPMTIKETRVDAAKGLVDLMDEAVAALPRCCGAPTLVLFGARDQLIPVRVARRVLRDLPAEGPHRVAFYRSGYHMLLRDLGRAQVVADIAAWIQAPAAPLPSGADQAGRVWLAERSD